MQTNPAPRSLWRNRRLWALLVAILLIVAAVGAWRAMGAGKGEGDPSSAGAGAGAPGGPGRPGGGKGGFDPNRPVPVSAQAVTRAPIERTVTALGTVTARANVTVRVLVDGQLEKVNFREGQFVKAGDVLAVVDPRPYEVSLANARAQYERDNAQLQNALVDQERYRGLLKDDSIPRQQLDTQEALVRQLTGTVAADKATIGSAELQLSYTRVTAPVTGRTGLRLVDAGNIVHASDATGLVTITQVQPIDVVFPLPQDTLPSVFARVRTGARLGVDAYDRDGTTLLARGQLESIDNAVDPSTGTVKLKAAFSNGDLALFPNQFVNVRLHLESIRDAITIPSAAVQRGAPGIYAWTVAADGKVGLRTLKLGATDGDRVQVLDGLAAGERVVVDGTDKLKDGAHVEVIEPGAASSGRAGPGGGHQRGAATAADPAAATPTPSGSAASPAAAAPGADPAPSGHHHRPSSPSGSQP